MVYFQEEAAPLDLSHHLSRVTKNRTPSSIKNYYRFFKISGIGNLASGAFKPPRARNGTRGGGGI